MLVELSKSQDIVAGDGTTSVVILAGGGRGVVFNVCGVCTRVVCVHVLYRVWHVTIISRRIP